jgi:hypothetical protein
MGSYPAQGFGGGGGSFSSVVINEENENFTATSTFADALVVNLQSTIDHVVQLSNTSSSASIEYKIYATPKVTSVVPNDNDDSWFNVLNDNNPSTYDHNKLKTIPALGKSSEGLSNRFAWLKVKIRAVSGSSIAKIWVRGTMP